ncbi:hypothetical protein CRG98_026931 [Punica granatum]|uniref:Uncharacterized protein n=1 Tax=Punica granatum TaxID=22663 RepID=A0A2I0J8U2_PUNGR|nr:hypothetical protein CRG98_026931 [Punica granatum]
MGVDSVLARVRRLTGSSHSSSEVCNLVFRLISFVLGISGKGSSPNSEGNKSVAYLTPKSGYGPSQHRTGPRRVPVRLHWATRSGTAL